MSQQTNLDIMTSLTRSLREATRRETVKTAIAIDFLDDLIDDDTYIYRLYQLRLFEDGKLNIGELERAFIYGNSE